jgi:alpha-glucosidase
MLAGAAAGQSVVMARVDSAAALPNGVEIHSGAAVMRVTALTDDVLRVRIGVGQLPEDASWAVANDIRQKSVSVSATKDDASVGFDTRAVHVRISRDPLQLVVTDMNGKVISADAAGHPAQLGNGADAQTQRGFTVWNQMPDDEHFFGLGDKPGPLDRRNEAFTLWNTDAYGWQESTDPLYKAIPFFMGFAKGRAYGIFLDNTWRTSFDFGKAERNAMSFGAEGGPLDYYILAGPEPKDVLRQYAMLTGAPPLPPRWSFGYQQSRYSYYPESQVREIASRLRADRIPADVLWLDIDYQDRNRPFTVDKQRFPDMPKLVADLKAEGFHVVPITDLHIAYTPDDPTYEPYKTGAAQNAFVHNPGGSVFVGKVWPGPSVFPDFTDTASRDWWGTNYKQFVGWGFAGFWNDMNEPSVFDGPDKTMPLNTVHRINDAATGFATRTATHREIHNVFGMEQTRGTYDGLRRIAPDERPFVMTRASYAGGQKYAVTWTGDNSATWNHLRQTTPQMENLGLSGFSFVGADAGGFAGSPQPDLLEKWLEISAFQPIDRDHTSKGTNPQEPWVNGPQREAVDRKYIELRYKLLPYIYTMAEETSRTGDPMLRPLFVEFPNGAKDGHPLDLDAGGEFLWGADFLVAPPTYPDEVDQYFLTLPPGGWYDFWSGARMPQSEGMSAIDAEIEKSKDPKFAERPDVKARRAEAARLQITPTLEDLPVYVRAGSIIPMEPLTQDTMQTPKGPLELRVYPPLAPGGECSGSVYWDDGHSFAYQRGDYARQQFSCAATANGLSVTLGKREGSYVPWWNDVDVVVVGAAGKAKATDAQNHSLKTSYDAKAGALHVMVPASADGGVISLQ